ncbi:MAG TPA: cadherin-like domain-containing protein, partial [Longimicrobium sp.]|nr:cadherin-like domain-containing protein [Longimicrobium sp.]
MATFTNLSITGAVGDRTLSFSATGLTSATSGTVTITAGAATQLAITTQPSDTAASGATFARQPVVQLRDASGNAVAQAGVSVTAAIASGAGTLGGTTTATTNASGVATFTNLSITGAVGDRTLSFSASGLTSATSGTITITAGAATQLVITTQPSSTAPAGATFAQQPVIQIRDASGNAVAQAGVSVTAAIASGAGTLGGTVTVTTDATGAATFTNLSIGGATGDRTISFSATGLTSVTSGTVTVTTGPAAALAFTVQPSNVLATAPITPAVQVTIRDAFGNVVTTATDNVTIAIGTNPSSGTLSGTVTVAAVNGVATFSDLSINRTGTGYTLAASSGTLTGAASTAFDVTHGPLDHFLVEQAGGGPIGNQLAGTPFNVRVTAQDALNNTVTTFTGTVAFTSTPAGGITAGGTSGAFTGGVLTSHAVTFGTPGSFTLTATRTGGTESGTSNAFEVQAPPTANDDAPAGNSAPGAPFHGAFNTTLNLPASGAGSLMNNDVRGFPAADVEKFGGGSLGGTVESNNAGSTVSFGTGGSLTVNADGSVSFTPSTGFTGNFTFSYRLRNVRGADDAQVTIAVGARPAAVNDTYSPVLVGNVPVNTATSTQFRVTANDAGDGKVLAITGATGGTATLNADSTFTFRPTAGYNGAASFTYTVTNGFGTTAPATVSLTVGTPVWFINAAGAAGGDGRYDAPFNSVGSFAAINNGTGNNPAISDAIFLYAGTYTGPLTLLNGQRLIGQRATAQLSSVAGVTWPADAGAEPAMSSASALDVTAAGVTAVTLNSANGTNLIRGLNFGNVGAAGTALGGTSFGTLTISETGINTNGRALNLSTGTLNGSFPLLTSTGGFNNVALVNVATTGTTTLGAAGNVLSGATGTGAAGGAVYISGQNGSYTIPSSVTNTASFAVNVISKNGGTVDFDGAITGTNAGIFLNANTGATIRFDGGMNVSSGSANAFTATGGGTVVATQNNTTVINTLTSTGGIALNVANTTIGAEGLSFRSIAANGGSNGIVLDNTGTTAGLTVAGNGTAGTGGTIQSTTVSGISLSTTRNVSLNWMNLTNANSTDGGGSGVCDGTTNAGCNGAVKLNNVRAITLNRLAISGSAEQGINGINVTGLTLSNSTISGAGNAINESGIYLFGLFGTTAAGTANSITNTTVT